MAITTPQSYWKMDESSGDAVDVVGGFNGTNTGVTYSAGKINNGAVFDGGLTTKLDLSTTAFAPTTAVSFSCWVNCASYASRQALFTKSDGVGNTTSVFSFEVGNTSGKATMTLFSSSNITTTTSSSLTTSVWTHLVFTYDGTNMKIYINGTLDVTTAGSITMNSITKATALGFYGSYNLLTLNGKLDECGFWSNYALTASEVTELYNGGTGLQYPFLTTITMIAGTGSFVLTGFDAVFSIAYTMIAATGSFILTGFDAVFTVTGGWINATKSAVATLTTGTKSAVATWTTRGKNQ